MKGSNNKDFFCFKDPKPKDLKSNLSCDNVIELAKKESGKNKKKRFLKHRREHTEKWKKQTLATGVNITKTGSKKKYSHITYYNYNKKSYYSLSYFKLLKN